MMDDKNDFNDDDAFNDIDDDDFQDFDEPQKGSLSELWNSSPWPKIIVLIGGIVTVIFGLSLLGGNDSETPESLVVAAPDQRETPGQEVPEAYRDAVEEVNQQRLLNALETGESAIPIPVGGGTSSLNDLEAEQDPPVDAEDPLAQWRQKTNPPPAPVEEQAPELPPIEPVTLEDPAYAPQPQYFQPDPEAIANLAGAMSGQMQSLIDQHSIRSLQHMDVTSHSFYNDPGILDGNSDEAYFEDDDAAAFETAPVDAEILIPAGAILYGQTLNEANSDTPGPVLARILNGPMAGTRIIGSFETRYDNLVITFNRIVMDGESHSANAVALDPETSIPGLATDVDRRYWKRVILPAAARFIEGIGEAIEQEGQTDVTVNNETITTSQNEIDTRQELFAGVNEAAREFGDLLDDEANEIEPLIRVDAGTMIGLLFTEAVIKPGTGAQIDDFDVFEPTPFTESAAESTTP